MGKVISVVNQKGGVGKTTTCVNLSAALQMAGRRVLLVDFDPQGNASSGLGVERGVSPTIYDVLTERRSAESAVIHTRFCDVLPANMSLSGAEVELVSMPEREFSLRAALMPLIPAYDFILIDCPPSLGLLTLNALCSSHSVLVPVQCEYYALEGLTDLLSTVKLVRTRLNPSLELEGVLLTMYDGRTNLSLQVAAEVKRHFPGKLYSAVVPRNVRLSEAPSHGMPVLYYDRGSKGADSYMDLAGELVRRNAALAGQA